MSIKLYSFGYLLNLVLYILALKLLNNLYVFNNIFLSSFIYGQFFPLNLLYIIYNTYNLNKNFYLINVIIGLLDFISLIMFFIGISKISIAEYLSYRTLSIFYNVILSYCFLKNTKIQKYELISIIVIVLTCICLLLLNNFSELIYILNIIVSTFLYSLCGFYIEKYKEKSDYLQIKLTSSCLSFITFIYMYVNDNNLILDLTNNLSLEFGILIIYIGISEYLYFFCRTIIISRLKNGSIFINILDIIRRIITFILSIFIFDTIYPIYMYVCYTILMMCCIIILISKLY